MSFSDIYKESNTQFSLEVFPPKTDKGQDLLLEELSKLKKINPRYISVTYGAMGSTRSLTQDLALKIHEKTGVPTAFHFTCVGSDREEIKKYVSELHERGINMVVALRGDVPQHQQKFIAPQNGFAHANDLVSYLRELKDFSIAVAGYPEKHVEAVSLEVDIENLKRKTDAGADIIITQLFFDNQKFYSWVEKVRRAGIQKPIVAGIMPILKLSQIERITQMSGATLPDDLRLNLEKHQNSDEDMIQIGVEHAIKQCEDLIANKIAGIHFYCLNKSDSVLKIASACRK